MKRMDNDYNYNNSKRIKLQVDDIWGDDPEIEEVDRCIDLATQICSQRPTNIQDSSINYENFNKSSIVASTQDNTALIKKIQFLENEKKKVYEENETKTGEIAFLRAQLKQAQNLVSKEKLERLKLVQQNQETWDEKLNNKNKELASLKCENELKDLETINLRQKLTELTKMYNINISLYDESQPTTTKTSEKETSNLDNSFVYYHKNIVYPYKGLLTHFQDKQKFTEKPHDIFHFILQVANYTEDEINTDSFIEFTAQLNKYIKEYFMGFLLKLQTNHKTSKSLYLNTNEVEYNFDDLFSVAPWSEFEVEIDLRRFIAIVAYLCEHNVFLLQEEDFYQTLLEITKHVKMNGLTEQLCGFLASLLKLLSVLVHRGTNSYQIIFEIFKQILCAQPNEPVLQYICLFLKYISEHGEFMSLLCTRKKSNDTQIKDGLLYFSDATCTLKVLCNIIETCKLEIQTACNLMHFLQNLVTCNVYWMYHQNQQSCGCLGDIYSLGLSILYKSLEKFTHNEAFSSIFHVGLLFLHVLTVRIPDLVAKSSRLYSQYQPIIKYTYKMRNELLLTTSHETMLDNLISQLKCDQPCSPSKSTAMNHFYDCNFINF